METSQGISILNTLLPVIGVIFIIAIGVVLLTQHFQKNLYIQKLEKEETKNLHQQELLKTSIRVQEEERKRIAQDLHDELGAVLSIARMHLVKLEEKAQEGNPADIGSLQNIRSLTENAISSMRRISHQLMPIQLGTFGLFKTLETVASQANKAGSITIRIHIPENTPPLSWDVQLGIYRIVMELINNSIRHSGASSIFITFQYSADMLSCVFSDDGKGMQNNNEQKGLGLENLKWRASAIDGNISVPNQTQGFMATLMVPVKTV